MSDSQYDYSQPKELQTYFKQKAEQEKQAKEQAAKELSAYEACVLKESTRVKELIAQAQAKDEHKD